MEGRWAFASGKKARRPSTGLPDGTLNPGFPHPVRGSVTRGYEAFVPPGLCWLPPGMRVANLALAVPRYV